MTQTPDNGWLDQMIEQEPQAREQFEPGDELAPTGEETDLNLLYTDLAAGPDVDSDPFRQQPEQPAADSA